ncbi:MAG: hypothetical protein Q8O89_07855 [Nanoarchaeota archaeon]|nr:hypothetical protein [Nanoarchaeota archaeon]
MIENLVGDGVCIASGRASFSFASKFDKEQIGKDQKVRLKYSLEGVTFSEDVTKYKIPVFENAFREGLPMIKTKFNSSEEFLDFLNYRSMRDYCRNGMGFVSRPEKLDVQQKSIKLDLGKEFKISSDDMGSVAFRHFSISYTAKGIIQVGGHVDTSLEVDNYQSLTAWAEETLPAKKY